MAAIISFLQTQPIVNVKLIKFSFQQHAEIDPTFVASFYNQLGNKWSIWNRLDGRFHLLNFNKDYFNPLLTKGWNELRDYYNIPDNAEIVLSYYGKDIYAMDSFNPIDTSSQIPPFHSRSTDPNKTIHFDLQLLQDQTKAESLILPLELANYIKTYIAHSWIYVCGDNGDNVQFDFVYRNGNYQITTDCKVGWKNFCFGNNCKQGDIIRFKFQIDDLLDKCHVFKLLST